MYKQKNAQMYKIPFFHLVSIDRIPAEQKLITSVQFLSVSDESLLNSFQTIIDIMFRF